MNREQLIKSLLQHELKLFQFSVWATFNDDGDLEYAITLNGEKPYGNDINLCKIGGNSDIEYTYDYVDFVIDDSIDEFYEHL